MMERMLSMFVAMQARIAEIQDEERGQTLVEYALVIALMVVVVAAAFKIAGLDTKVSSTLSVLASKF